MSDQPNYRSLEPPSDKPLSEYTAAERRAKIYNLIEQAGHYRNIETSQEELGNRFDVCQQMISKDIRVINEWMKEELGNNAEAELESLKNAAVRELLRENRYDEAYDLAAEHFRLLQDMGKKDKENDTVEVKWREFVEGDE